MGRPKGSLNKSTLAKMRQKKMVCNTCMCCGETNLPEDKFYCSSSSRMWKASLQRPLFCRDCIDKEFTELSGRYGERDALIAICAILDLPYIPDIYYSIIMKNSEFKLSGYISRLNNNQWSRRSFITSIVDGSIGTTSEEVEEVKEKRWRQAEKNNRDEVIDMLGYDPFDGYNNDDRRFLFSDLIKYFDDDIENDPYKLSQIIQIVNNNNQIRQYDLLIARLDPKRNAEDIKQLNQLKKDLVSSNDKIAKENEISVKNRSNKDVGKSTLTFLMKDLRDKDFKEAEVNYYDQLRSEGTLWAIDMSHKAICRNAMFDENDRQEIFELQRKKIKELQEQLDDVMEENRLLKIAEADADVEAGEDDE